MSGGLTRVVLLTQGQLRVAEPLLPSRFAPIEEAPPTMNPLETVDWPSGVTSLASDSEAPPASRRQPAQQAGRAPADQKGSAAAMGSLAPPSSEVPSPADALTGSLGAPFASQAPEVAAPRRARAAAQPVAGGLPSETPPHVPHILASLQRAPAVETLADGVPLRPALEMYRETDPGRGPPRSRLASALVPSPGAGPIMRAPPPAVAPAATPPHIPDVHISIGRVEVNAAPASAPVRSPAVRRPHLSLAEYLAQRR